MPHRLPVGLVRHWRFLTDVLTVLLAVLLIRSATSQEETHRVRGSHRRNRRRPPR